MVSVGELKGAHGVVVYVHCWIGPPWGMARVLGALDYEEEGRGWGGYMVDRQAIALAMREVECMVC